MKKLLMITAGFLLALGLVSCEKQDKNSADFPGQGTVKATMEVMAAPMESVPEVSGALGPFIIPPVSGKDRGGNRTCEDAKAAWADLFPDADPILVDCDECGTKVDVDDDYEGDVYGFPFHVWVNEDGSIGFSVEEGDLDCDVEVVIVKGSNKANVYFFPDGTLGADGLAAPAFDPDVPSRFPWVSNITFCYSCEPPDEEEPELVIALKTGLEKMVEEERVTSYAYTPGDYSWNSNTTSIAIGFHELGFGSDFSVVIKPADGGAEIGTITATRVDDGGVPSFYVVVEITEGGWDVHTPHLYLGSETGLEALTTYVDFPFDESDATITGNICTFLIPEADISW